jgi:uncharacterized protein
MNPLVGIGLRSPHYKVFMTTLPKVGWLEVHSENFFASGGATLSVLQQARQHYPISLHGVGLGLGSALSPDRQHLRQLKQLIDIIQQVRVSDHACWSRVQLQNRPLITHFNDLLPLPYTEEAVMTLSAHIREAQDYLGCRLLIENVSDYLRYPQDEMTEVQFMHAVVTEADCALLLDINNLYVNAYNHVNIDSNNVAARSSDAYTKVLAELPILLQLGSRIQEIHLAGHSTNGDLKIDDHGSGVCDEVWAIYHHVIKELGPTPTLIEWDTALPELSVLLAEAQKASDIITNMGMLSHA